MARTLQKEQVLRLGLDRIKRLKPELEANASKSHECKKWFEDIGELTNFSHFASPIHCTQKFLDNASQSFALSANFFLEELLERRTQQGAQVFIGVLGSTGSGKSSLINAVLDRSVVPSSCFRACTSCVVEVRWNESAAAADKYSADIQYVTQVQWASELRILIRDVMNGFEIDELGDDISTTKAAEDKLHVLYPGLDAKSLRGMTIEHALDHLNKLRDLSSLLGQTIKIRESSAQAFSQQVNEIVSSAGTDDQTVCWPLVEVVKVFSSAPILQNGLVLVDLPGQGDYNTARARIAEQYIGKLDRIWIVSEIKRAVDESVARHLLGQNLQTHLLMANMYDESFITVIVTHTDNIDYNETISLLQGQDQPLTELLREEKKQQNALQAIIKQRKAIPKALKKINTERKSLKGDLGDCTQRLEKKRKRDKLDNVPDSPTGSSKEIPSSRLSHLDEQRLILLSEQRAVKQREPELETQVNRLRIQVLQECVAARNRWAQNRLRIDFVDGQVSIKQKGKELSTSGSANCTAIPKNNGNRGCSQVKSANYEKILHQNLFRYFVCH